MYKTSRVHQEIHYLPSQIKPVTTSANPLLAPGMDLGQPEPGSTIQWLILGFQGRPGPSSSSTAQRMAEAAHSRGHSAGAAQGREGWRAPKVFQARWFNAKRRDTRLCQVLKRPRTMGLGCRKRGLAGMAVPRAGSLRTQQRIHHWKCLGADGMHTASIPRAAQ